MKWKELRKQAVLELMRENNQRMKEGQNHNPPGAMRASSKNG